MKTLFTQLAATAIVAALGLLLPRAGLAGEMSFGAPDVLPLYLGPGITGEAFDIAILAEGFTAREMTLFSLEAREIKRAILGAEPYHTYASYIRIWQVNTISLDSGIDRGWSGVSKNTCFDAGYYRGFGDTTPPGRMIDWNDGRNLRTAKNRIATNRLDAVILLVNDGFYGGTARGETCAVTNHSDMSSTALHELGHTLGLGDEYCTGLYTYGSWHFESRWPNLTMVGAAGRTKWSPWVGEALPSGDRVSTYQGGAERYRFGLYRPVRFDCRMNDSDRAYCPVCREAIIRRLSERTDMIRGSWNSCTSEWWRGTDVNTGSFVAYVDVIVPERVIHVVWEVDGAATWSSWSYNLDARTRRHVLRAALPSGSHRVSVKVIDGSDQLRIGGWAERPCATVGWSFEQQ